MGDSAEKRAVRLEQVLAKSLELLQSGQIDAAQHELAQAIGAPVAAPEAAFRDEVTDGELDAAFEAAEADRDEMVDADQVAQDAIRQTDGAYADALGPEIGASFATETMAGLLESQGDEAAAARIRRGLDREPPAATPSSAGYPKRADVVDTLERWLANLRRGAGS